MCVEYVAAVNATAVDGDFQNHYCYDNVSFFWLKFYVFSWVVFVAHINTPLMIK